MAYKDPQDERNRKARREWYYRNKEKQSQYKKKRDQDLKKWLESQKIKCSRCPEDYPATLKFHHRDPLQKEITLSRALRNGWSAERMEKEIAKCEVLCGNCHDKHHWEIRLMVNQRIPNP